MKYSELIELYRNGKLGDDEKTQVENDIERHVAISEYLFDEEIPEFDEIGINTDDSDALKEDKEQEKFLKMIRAAIRKAFIKTGIIVGTVVLVICMFFIFAFPKVVDMLYYNPTENIGGESSVSTNRISLDIMAYTELFVPGYFRSDVLCDSNGYGNYDINIKQLSSYSGLFIDVAGKIEKGELKLYDNNLLKTPTGNAFMPNDSMLRDYHAGMGPAGSSKESFEKLDDLSEDEYYIAYVTLNKVLSYSEFVEWEMQWDADPSWCAFCQKSDNIQYEETNGYFREDIIGFIYSSSCSQMAYDEEKYPYLTYFDATTTTGEEKDWVISENIMLKHVTSLLRYMDDQKDFREMMEMYQEDGYLSKMADNIEQNGLYIYGYVTIGKKADLIKLKDIEGLEYVYTRLLR